MQIRPALLIVLAFALAVRLIALATASSPKAFDDARHGTKAMSNVMQNASRADLQRTSSRASIQMLPVLVDGSRTPEAVPDNVAERVFVRSLADSDRRETTLMRLQLGPTDRSAFLDALGATPDRIVKIAEQREALSSAKSPEATEARATLKSEEDQLLDAAYLRVMSALTNSGASKVSQYVHIEVKRRLKGFSVSAAMQH